MNDNFEQFKNFIATIIKFSFKSQPENNCNFTSGNLIADSEETLSLRAYTVLEAVAVQAGLVIHTQKHTSLHAWTKTCEDSLKLVLIKNEIFF